VAWAKDQPYVREENRFGSSATIGEVDAERLWQAIPGGRSSDPDVAPPYDYEEEHSTPSPDQWRYLKYEYNPFLFLDARPIQNEATLVPRLYSPDGSLAVMEGLMEEWCPEADPIAHGLTHFRQVCERETYLVQYYLARQEELFTETRREGYGDVNAAPKPVEDLRKLYHVGSLYQTLCGKHKTFTSAGQLRRWFEVLNRFYFYPGYSIRTPVGLCK